MMQVNYTVIFDFQYFSSEFLIESFFFFDNTTFIVEI